jgi:hypothetical protein
MTDTVQVAIISGGGTVLTAVCALILSYRGFASLDTRMLALENRLYDLTGAINDLDKRLIKVEIKLGIQP